MNENAKTGHVTEIAAHNYEAEVLGARGSVVVAFVAPWSRPCQVIDGVIEEVAGACAGQVKVFKVNADDNPDLSIIYDIQSIPTLLFYQDGNLCAKIIGTASKEAVQEKLHALTRLQAIRADVVNQPGEPKA